MKANELRIGNWIVCKYRYPNDDGDGYFTETTVKPNDLHDRSQEHPEGYCPINLYPDNYKPIPLTEDWLFRFGFNKDNGRYFKKLFCLHINYTEDSIKYFNYIPDIIDEFTVKYVHQLQNLYFALTQKELTIK